jgi:alkanesulfonate monooxygenase SsuD/methylene tetrahydromethanopterin reductase-like flavin-dependent oxidoreductase (luciferase family)
MVKTKFGLRLPAFPIDGSSGETFIAQTLAFTADLEQVFDSAWVCDHFIPWASFFPEQTPNLEGFTTVCYLSGIHQNLTFGNIVLCNSYRNPALLAKMGATLQLLTNGRFILGIGAGWKGDEYKAYGYEFPPPKVRIHQLNEAVQIIKKMWTEQKVTFEGQYYQIMDAICSPKPQPIPPIMIGGGGEQLTLRVVAQYADWWNLPNVSVPTFKHKIKVLQQHCHAVKRSPREITKTLGSIVAIAKTEKAARRLASNTPFITMETEENYIIGDVDQVITRIREYTDLGIKYFILRFADFPKTQGAQIFAQKVIPKI